MKLSFQHKYIFVNEVPRKYHLAKGTPSEKYQTESPRPDLCHPQAQSTAYQQTHDGMNRTMIFWNLGGIYSYIVSVSGF